MKKICLALAIVLIVFLCPQKRLKFYDGSGVYTFYVGNASSTAEIISVEFDKAEEVFESLKNVCGESLCTDDKEYFDRVLKRLNAEFLFEEQTNGIISKYYYSEQISAYKTINGQKVNVQTSVRDSNYSIGSPLIFGSF